VAVTAPVVALAALDAPLVTAAVVELTAVATALVVALAAFDAPLVTVEAADGAVGAAAVGAGAGAAGAGPVVAVGWLLTAAATWLATDTG
jgi:hypothetical protein